MEMNMAQQESQAFKQLKEQLREMFQLDRGDLDFGLYRIMNQKRGEVTEFLEKQLLPQVQTVLQEYQPAGGAGTQAELDKMIASLSDAGVDPEASPKVQELRAKLSDVVDMGKLENQIYSDLYNFFKRYYSEGDFMSMRRYKEGVYALPYEGEEVKLHWANHDQYYIKTSENLKNYSFKTAGGKRVRFEVVAGGTEVANNKAAEDKERRFVLHDAEPTVVIADELTIRFEYRPVEGKRKQDDITKETLEKLFNLAEVSSFGLNEKAPTEKNAERTLLEKHLSNYTAKHSFDYFIHKDLGRFLRQELDFYIKNEIMHLDDIENETAPKVETYLAKVKAMRKVAGKIIQFLAQLEDFQKKLWLKKKFVLETHYCITLDHIIDSEAEDELLPIIAANEKQREEWVKLFAIDDLEDYSTPLTPSFLKANDKLLVDTKFFDTAFKYRLLSLFDNLDEQTDGVMINSENFQALNLLQERYKEKVKCIYIDPPYNTGEEDFIYKDTYQHSSWLSMIDDRIKLSKYFINQSARFFCSIDDRENSKLLELLFQNFGKENYLNAITWEKRTKSQNTKTAKYMLQSKIEYVHPFRFENKRQEFKLEVSGTKEYPYSDERGNYRLQKAEMDSLDRPHAAQSMVYDLLGVFPKKGKAWKFGKATAQTYIDEDRVHLIDGWPSIRFYEHEESQDIFKPFWSHFFDKDVYGTAESGLNLLDKQMGFGKEFQTVKPVELVSKLLFHSSQSNDLILDFFAGSGTTGHSVIQLNRDDLANGIDASRKYILCEMGTYFSKYTHPRILKAAYSKDWKGGKPVSREGVSHILKYMALEQYEDALDNLGLNKSETQAALLASNKALNEQYMLGYMLDVESRGSGSLLNIDDFADPFAYTLRITRNDDTQLVNVDLVETFNYLLGLTIRTVDRDKTGIVTVTGKNALGENCLIIWRNALEVDNDRLDAWFGKRYSSKDFEFDAIYVNGDNNIENMKLADDHWKVRLIEAEFKRLMFDVQDV
jgi:adenine-specific DNA-methyltransferase